MMVKICGITNREDAVAAIEGGAAAVGFVFHPASPRYIDPQRAGEIIAGLPAAAWKVGVFVNQPRAGDIAREIGLDVVQLHGAETEYPAGIRVWRAVRVTQGFSLAAWQDCPAEALLLDGPASGTAFDWTLARGARRLILAGGLDADNVRRAIAAVRPWGVDASSRLESAPGRKDHVKMAAFLRAALAPL